MGRKIICPKCNTQFDEGVLIAKNSENVCLVCGANLSDDEGIDPQSGWITWWYLKDKRHDDDYSLWDKMPKHPDYFEIIKEFKAPPRDSNGSSEEAKKILRTYIPDAFAPAKQQTAIRCPYCFSTEYTLLNRGYGLLTGFLGSGRIKRVCNRCKREF